MTTTTAMGKNGRSRWARTTSGPMLRPSFLSLTEVPLTTKTQAEETMVTMITVTMIWLRSRRTPALGRSAGGKAAEAPPVRRPSA